MKGTKVGAVVAMGILPVAAAAAWIPAGVLGESGPAGSVIALYVAMLLGVALVLPLVRRAPWRAATRASTALACLAMLPVVALSLIAAKNEPFIWSHWVCGTGMLHLIVGVPFAALALLGPSAPIAHGIVVAGRRFIGPIVKGAAMLVIGALSITIALGSVGRERPSLEQWQDTLDVAAEVELPAADATRAIALGDGTLVLAECDADTELCGLRLCTELATSARDTCGDVADVRIPAGTIVVKRDPDHDLFIVEHEGHGTVAYDDAFRAVDVSRADIDDVLAKPTPYRVLSWLGLAGAFLAGLAGFFASRRRRALDRGREGISDGNVVRFVDGSFPGRGPLTNASADGPVVAHSVLAQMPPTYRDDGARGAWHATPGTLVEQREAIALTVLSWDATALAIALFSALPVLV